MTGTDFISVFLNSLISPPRLSSDKNPEQFLGQVFPCTDDEIPPFVSALSGGRLCANFPWSFTVGSLDCFILLQTEKGCGKLLLDEQIYPLDAGSFLLLDCKQQFCMDIASEPWVYQVVFCHGVSLPYYRQLLSGNRFYIFHTFPFSDISVSVERLLKLFPGVLPSQKLMIADFINHIITSCIVSSLTGEKCPPEKLKKFAFFSSMNFKSPIP